jgi:hypothetical protein
MMAVSDTAIFLVLMMDQAAEAEAAADGSVRIE